MRLKSFHFRNYKSFGGLVTFTPGDITLLTGATGSGKSNVISFPCFLRRMLYADGRLREYVVSINGINCTSHAKPERPPGCALPGRAGLRSGSGNHTMAVLNEKISTLIP